MPVQPSKGDIEASFDVADFLLSRGWTVTKRLYLSMILGELPTPGRLRLVSHPLHCEERFTTNS
jgi:hypothetical protein